LPGWLPGWSSLCSEGVRFQLADQIRAGWLVADQRLPSMRQLATDLRIATGIVGPKDRVG
jgi:DNA-binding transcriptional regulator YhcF (GntR family)